MRVPTTFSFLGVFLATLFALAAGPVNAIQIDVRHNGFDLPGIFDGHGTEGVRVRFGCRPGRAEELGEGGDFGLECKKEVGDVTTHRFGIFVGGMPELTVELFESDDLFGLPILETVENSTVETWTDYHIDLRGLAFVLPRAEIRCRDGVGCRVEQTRHSLWAFFDQGLDPGQQFQLSFGLGLDLDLSIGICERVSLS